MAMKEEKGVPTMKNKTVSLMLITVALSCVTLRGQDSNKMQGMGMQKHQQMMPVHAKIIEMQKAQDGEIDRLLSEMNNASGEKRVDAIVAVLNKLVEQRKAMNAEMAAHLDR
jgi:hypothetical protein